MEQNIKEIITIVLPIISIVLYSLIVSEHVHNLEHENAKLIDEMQKVEHELVSYKYLHDNSYIGFDETK